MRGICALYGTETDLRLSHIIPKFAIDYMKKTGTQFLRKIDEPDKRIQDGLKLYLLGEKAEQEFSKRERWFANSIFFPYLQTNPKSLTYDENLAYFLISVLWRVLLEQLTHEEVSNDTRLSFLRSVSEEWRLFLSEYKFPYLYNDLHIFFTDRIKLNTSELKNADVFFTRNIDATIVVNKDYSEVVIYAKFLRFIFWCNVKGINNNDKSTKVDYLSGTINFPQEMHHDFMIGFFGNRIRTFNSIPDLSDERKKKVNSFIMRNEEKFWESDLGQALRNDSNINKPS
ncbi:hypothetical protein ACLI08_05050 [Flavobacterium sp. RNTU_13]|uniref:hypothetical protein n=1 Tax=Flavobacterium sp. RNTU_13 TaxID=3375145 RepID=UPI0039881E3B